MFRDLPFYGLNLTLNSELLLLRYLPTERLNFFHVLQYVVLGSHGSLRVSIGNEVSLEFVSLLLFSRDLVWSLDGGNVELREV